MSVPESPDAFRGSESGSLGAGGGIRTRLLRGSAWVLGGKAALAAGGIAANALLARLLPPPEVGAYFLLASFVLIGSTIGQLGMKQAVVRLVAESMALRQPARARQAILRSLLAGLVGTAGVVAFVLVGPGRWLALDLLHSPLVAAALPLACLWLAANVFQGLLSETFRGFHDIRRATQLESLLPSLLLPASLALIWIVGGRTHLHTVLWVASGSVSLTTMAGFVLLGGHLRGHQEDLSRFTVTAAELVRLAAPLLVVSMTTFLLTSGIDVWIVGVFRSQAEVAVYGAATRLIQLVFVSLVVLNAVAMPIVAELFAQGRRNELQKTLRAVAALAFVPSLLVTVLFILWGRLILRATYGDFYGQGASILIVLALGQLVGVWTGSCGITLMMTGHQTPMMAVTATTGITSVLLGAILADRFGAVGVAAATSTMFVLQNVTALLLARRYVGVWTHARFTLKPRELADILLLR